MNNVINKPLVIIGGAGHGCVIESIDIPDTQWATIIHKTAFVDPSVQLEPGVFIMFNAYTAPRTKIGKFL